MLFVNDTLDLKGNAEFQINDNASLYIFVKEGGKIKFVGGGGESKEDKIRFEGAIYAPGATIDFSGNGTYVGAFIAKNYKCGGPGNIEIIHKYYSSENLPVLAYEKGTWLEE